MSHSKGIARGVSGISTQFWWWAAALLLTFVKELPQQLCTSIHRWDISWFNYIDDFPSTEPQGIVWDSYDALGRLFRDLGVQESPEKASPPDHVVVFLGTWFNAREQTMFVTPDRDMVHQATIRIAHRKTCLLFCVRPGRLFVSRLLTFLTTMKRGCWYTITEAARLDIKWWWDYLPYFNTVNILWMEQVTKADVIVATDASMKGAGGVTDTEYFRFDFPDWILVEDRNIAHLEMLAALVGLKLWILKCKGKRIHMNCDNQAVVTMTNSGNSQDKFMQHALQELCYLCALNTCEIGAVHIKGVNNHLPDFLSRWNLGAKFRREFKRENSKLKLKRRMISPKILRLSNNW